MLLAYADVDPVTAIPFLESVSPAVRALYCPYENAHELRTRRDERPFSPDAQDLLPALTEEQSVAFAQADVLLSLDVPMGLGAVAPRLRWVQNVGSGYGRYRSAGLAEAGIVLTNAAGLGAPGIAEFVLARLLEHWKRLPEIADRQRRRDWGFTFGRSAAGRTVVIVGMGAIGRAVAQVCAALRMRVVGVARTVPAGGMDGIDGLDEVFSAAEMHAALAEADAVVLCATDTADNENLFDQKAFAAMPTGSFFVNVSRGRLVADEALVSALEGGHLAAAAIGVTRVEPVPADSPLWTTPGLRLSPHSATSQDGYTDRVLDLFRDNLHRFLTGRPLRNVVPLT